jgi:hypothetical protein
MKRCPIKIAAALALALGCTTTSGVSTPGAAPAAPGPASWQGRLADRMNQTSLGPATPALRPLYGQAPLVYLARVPARGAFTEPAFELAVFEDGTFVYEGHRCVEVGGVVVMRLPNDALTKVQDLLATLCSGFDAAANDDQLCADSATLHLACSDGERIRAGSDHCRQHDDAAGQSIHALVDALTEELQLSTWFGEPARRQSCTPGSRDLSPHELAKTIRSDLADAGARR